MQCYKIFKKAKIGGGGFGEIYEAIDLQNHNERVAIKVILVDFSTLLH